MGTKWSLPKWPGVGVPSILRRCEVDIWNLYQILYKKRFGLVTPLRSQFSPIFWCHFFTAWREIPEKWPEVGDPIILRSWEVDFWNLRQILLKKTFGLWITESLEKYNNLFFSKEIQLKLQSLDPDDVITKFSIFD